jgi:flagellar biosynthesis protein FlhB
VAEDSAQEKTEKATPKRLKDARDKGQVARSRELNSAALVLLGTAGLWALGGHLGSVFAGLMRAGFTVERPDALDPSALATRLGEAAGQALWALAPWLLLAVVVAAAAPLLLGGFLARSRPARRWPSFWCSAASPGWRCGRWRRRCWRSAASRCRARSCTPAGWRPRRFS